MTPSIEDGATHCPHCSHPLAFRLNAIEGGGLRYDVSCTPCGEVYYEFCTPVFTLPVAA